MSEFVTRRRVEFSDTDAGSTVHFSRFFAYMETAEDEFLRSLGASFAEFDGKKMGWPKVSASCDYRNPIRYGDEITIALRIVERSSRTVTYAFDITRKGTPIASGRTVSVCCAEKAGGGYEAILIPEKLVASLTPAESPS